MSIFCGAIIGLEREYKNKSAGFRTVILICFGATMFTLASKLGNMADDRIAANIVTGIGFLGAGVIFQGKFSVQGLTTAAVIWTTAAIGMFVGFGEFLLSIALSFIMVLILSLLQKIEVLMSDIYLTKTVYITFKNTDLSNIYDFHNFLEKNNVKYLRKGIGKENDRVNAVYEISGNRKKIRNLNEHLIGLDFIDTFSNVEK